MEHETYITCRVPSQSKSIAKYFPYKESNLKIAYVVCQISNIVTGMEFLASSFASS